MVLLDLSVAKVDRMLPEVKVEVRGMVSLSEQGDGNNGGESSGVHSRSKSRHKSKAN